MKKLLLISWLMGISTFRVQAQQSESTRFLINGRASITGFGGPLTEFSRVRNDWVVSAGGGGAVLINQTFFFGGYGIGMATDRRMDIPSETNLQLSLGHGGLWLGYLYRSSRLIHAGIDAKLGWGSITLSRHINNSTANETQNVNTNNVFVITPQIQAELNIIRWFKINVGAGYRLVTGVDKNYYSTSDFNSPSLTVGLLFGGFERR